MAIGTIAKSCHIPVGVVEKVGRLKLRYGRLVLIERRESDFRASRANRAARRVPLVHEKDVRIARDNARFGTKRNGKRRRGKRGGKRAVEIEVTTRTSRGDRANRFSIHGAVLRARRSRTA